MNQQVYTILRATTEGAVFDLVENAPKGAGLEAWRALHRKFDPSTGGRKRIMLQALTSPERSSYENLGNALERWKALRNRYDRKKDQFGKREVLQDSLAMNALEKLVPKEMEQHLMLNYTRFRTFEEMEQEVVTYMEAKTGSKLTISKDFSKSSAGDVAPMDVDSLVRAVNGNLASLVKGKKGGGKGGKAKFEGNCDNCGKKGHKKKDCWSKPQQGSKGGGAKSRSNSQSAGKGKFEGICNNCGKKGHMKKDWAVELHHRRRLQVRKVAKAASGKRHRWSSREMNRKAKRTGWIFASCRQRRGCLQRPRLRKGWLSNDESLVARSTC